MNVQLRRGAFGLAVWLLACLAAAAGPLEDGRAAYGKSDYPVAYEAFSKAFRENPDNPEAAIGLGLAAEALGNLARAQFAFERALTLDPANHAARMELARTYQAMGLYELARQEYLRLLGSQPPDAMRARIDQELERIAQEQKHGVWTGKATIEALYDSNVQFGPAHDLVDTRIGALSVTDDSKPKDALGAAVSGALDGLFELGSRGGWVGIAGANAYVETLADAESFAVQDFNAYAGGRFVNGAWLLDLPLKARLFAMDWNRLVTIGAFGPVWGWAPAPRWRLYSSANLEARDFADNGRDSTAISLNQAVRRQFGAGAGNSLTASAGLFREDADLGGYDNQGWEVSLRGDKSLPWDMAASAGMAYRAVRYDDTLYPLLQDEAREDRQWSGSVGLSRTISERCIAELSWSAEQTDSNFDLYTYRRQVVRLGITVSL